MGMVGRRRVPGRRARPRQHCGAPARLARRRAVPCRSHEGRSQRMNQPVLEALGLTKIYHRGSEEVRALNGVSFEIAPHEFVAVTGPSGAGKTTLLSLVGGMDSPTSGVLKISGREIQHLDER